MSQTKRIEVLDRSITLYRHRDEDFISLTDIARHRDAERGDYIIQNWMRNRNTIQFLGIWKQLNNPHFNSIEFDGIKNQAGLNSFSLTPKRWISETGAIGIVAIPDMGTPMKSGVSFPLKGLLNGSGIFSTFRTRIC